MSVLLISDTQHDPEKLFLVKRNSRLTCRKRRCENWLPKQSTQEKQKAKTPGDNLSSLWPCPLVTWLQPNCKPKRCRDLPKKSLHGEVRAPETQRVLFPGTGNLFLGRLRVLRGQSWSETLPQGNLRDWCRCVFCKKKKNQTSCPWEMKPGSADVISSIDFSRSNTSHNSRQCHRGPSNLQIGLIKGLLLCQLDNQCLLYYYGN